MIDDRLLATLAPLSPRQWCAYVVRLAWSPAAEGASRQVVLESRLLAWQLARLLLAVTGAALVGLDALRRPAAPAPVTAPAEPAADARTTVTATGVHIRDKRKVPREPQPRSVKVEPEAEAPAPAGSDRRAWTRLAWPWWALVGAVLRYANGRSLPRGLSVVATGRAACGDRLRVAVVADRPQAQMDIDGLLTLAEDDVPGDWRMPVAFWMREHLPASTRADVVLRGLAAPDALPRGRLSVLLRVAATTVSALPDAGARTLLVTALALSRRELDPYGYGGTVVAARNLVVRMLVERPELDDAVRDSLKLQAPCSARPVVPVELRLLALALRERAPDAGSALAAAAVSAGTSPAQLRSLATLANQPLPRPPSVRTLARARAPLARALRALVFVLPWLWPLAVMSAVGFAVHRLRWAEAPKEFALAEAVPALALLATVNVFTVQLSAQRLGGVVARYAAQPASLQASYSAVLAAVVVAVAPATPARFGAARSWIGLTALAVFVVMFLVALLRFQRQSDAARAAAAHVRVILPGARAAGRRFGRLQARAVAMNDALDAVSMVTTSMDEVHGEWRTLVVAPRRGLLVPRRGDLRALLSTAPFSAGLQLRLFVGLGKLVRVGEHLGALVPSVDQRVDQRTRGRAARRLRITSSDDVEDVQRSAIALVQLALQLAGAGDVGTAERVCRSVVDLVSAHTAAARGARAAAFRRQAVRAAVGATGLRGEWIAAQAARRRDDDELVPVVPALGATVRLVAQAQTGPQQHNFEVSANLLIPLLDATAESDGALMMLPLGASSTDGGTRLVGRTDLLRLVGVRAVELGADTAFDGVLRQLDHLVAAGELDAAARSTSVLAAITARSDPRLAARAMRRFLAQVGRGTATAQQRQHGLWRIGAAALAAGTPSVAVEVAVILAALGDEVAVRAAAQDGTQLAQEALMASLYGGYLGKHDRDALANFGTFLADLAPLLPAPGAGATPKP